MFTKVKFSKGIVLAAALTSLIVLNVPASGSKPICEAGLLSGSSQALTLAPIAEIQSWPKNQRVLIVVDAAGPGAEYVVECNKLYPDVKVVHVQVGDKMPPGLSGYSPDQYDANLIYDGSNLAFFQKLFDGFDKDGLRVLAGCEPGVQTADLIASTLRVYVNKMDLTAARTDKELLAENVGPLLKEQPNLRVIPGKSFANASDAVAHLARQEWAYPLVLKPTESAGNHGFHFIDSVSQLPGVFDELIGTEDPLGKKIHKLLIQPRIDGTVVAVNTTYHPQLGVYHNDMWRTRVRFTDTGVAFLRTQIARFDTGNSQHVELMRATAFAAQGLGVHFGPMHPEFLVTPSGLIYLMDVGVRPVGGSLAQRARACGATDHIHAALHAAFDPRKFAELQKQGPTLNKQLALIYFVNTREGILKQVPSEEEMRRRISGYVSRNVDHMIVDKPLKVTTSLFDQPGYVVVEGDDASMDAAEAAIRDWESKDFYKFK